jgi:type III restriction enzyme
VRVIITKAALAEGWDCPFAYVLCSLAANGNESAMTQLVGRILRQPHALRVGTNTNPSVLDESYVFTHRAETRAVVAAIKSGLENDGLSDLVQDVILKDPAGKAVTKRPLYRRDAFRTTDIALPQVLWIETGQQARPLDAESDLFPVIDWQGLDLRDFVRDLPANAHVAESQLVRISTGEEKDFVTEAAAPVRLTQEFDGAHAVRMITDIVPNPFVARELVETVLTGLVARGLDNVTIGGMSAFIIDELRKVLSRYRDEQAAVLFSAALDSGQIEFRVRGDAGDWIAPEHIWTIAEENARQVNGKTGQAMERSLFLPVYAQDLNSEEQSVAVYLDAETVIRWWHRNGTGRQSYAVRGWRRGNVYPDFVFAALRDEDQTRIVAVETKGEQLSGNLDTVYKTTLLDRLSAAYGTQCQANGGDLAKRRTAIDFQAAVVLFGDIKAKLPVLIHGDAGAMKD